MNDYQIQPPTRRCAVTGRELRPGERFYTALLEDGDKFRRVDYSSEAWQGPPPNAFSFWCGRVPPQEGPPRWQVDEDLLLDCLQRLAEQKERSKIAFRYVLALLLLRRKRLHFEEVRQEQGQEVLYLRCSRTRERYEVVNPGLTPEELAATQEEVFRLLGWD
jgi:hypothetical protein